MSIDEFLRFKDLQRLNVVKSWPQLRYMQDQYGFPEGKLLGANTRAWPSSEVKEWLDSRPTASSLIKQRAEKSVLAKRAKQKAGADATI
jgi:predicted DNA-binding transcriptional regulator AlpA